MGPDYTRVSEDTAVLCRRADFPRAVNLLQRRAPDHRRWRQALRGVAGTAGRALDGMRRNWMGGALREVLAGVTAPWLQRELILDVHAAGGGDLAPGELLPVWTARGVWHAAEAAGVPMAYVAQVTVLPRAIDAPVDTAQLVTDFRCTARAHREHAAELASRLPMRGPTCALPMDEMLVQLQVDSQRDAAERWRALAQRLLNGG